MLYISGDIAIETFKLLALHVEKIHDLPSEKLILFRDKNIKGLLFTTFKMVPASHWCKKVKILCPRVAFLKSRSNKEKHLKYAQVEMSIFFGSLRI